MHFHARLFACVALGCVALVHLGAPRLATRLVPAAPVSYSAVKPDHLPPPALEGKTDFVGHPREVAHASFLNVSPSGQLVLSWFSGSREGASDVQILQSSLSGAGWSMPTAFVSRQTISMATAKNIRKLGNTAFHVDSQGGMHAFVTSVSLGGWAGARLEHLRSKDGGEHWSHAKTLVLSPFLNVSTLSRSSAINLTSGGFVLPVYHEFLRKAPELLEFDTQGDLVRKQRIGFTPETLQPSLVAGLGHSSGAVWQAYLRNDAKGSQSLQSVSSVDGVHFARPLATSLGNRDTAVAAQRLPNGLTAMLYNPSDRRELRMALSKDGQLFQDAAVLVRAESGEYSYPSMALYSGRLWVSYTSRREAIAVTSFDLAGLKL